jgi:hypothetical protein
MSVKQAFVRGLRQASSSVKLLSVLWLVNVAVALPAAWMVGDVLSEALGESLVADEMRQGFAMDWYAELEARAEGLAATFTPSLAGPGVVLDNLEAWWSGKLFQPTSGAARPHTGQSAGGDDEPVFRGLVLVGIGYALLWAFLLGGILDRLARPGPVTVERLAASGGRYFARFVQLAAISGVLYFLVYLLGRRLYRLVDNLTRDVTEERTVRLWILLAAALVVVLLHLVRMVFDYAKIATVMDDRRNVLSSLRAGVATVLGRPLSTAGVYVGFGILAVGLTAIYLAVAPGVGPASLPGILLAFVLAQVYLVARLFLRVGLLGGQLSFYAGSAAVPPASEAGSAGVPPASEVSFPTA